MKISVDPASPSELLSWRERFRAETKGQIVHDSLHRRDGWTVSYLFSVDGQPVGYGSTAVAGPWTGQPTILELYIQPEQRFRAFALFEAFLAGCGARHFEVQANDELLTVMLHAYGQDIVSEKIVFEDKLATALPGKGALLGRISTEANDRRCVEQRQGGSEWRLDFEGATVATGGINFHYNQPYGDIYMEVMEGYRRQGWGAYMVQELKRVTYQLGQIPCARCNTSNIASRRTTQKAGFVPCGHILLGSIAGNS